jgi:hypothetical protein
MKISIVALSDYLEANADERTEQVLSSFSCPMNKDIEAFLVKSAIPFAKKRIAQTHLVSTVHNGENIILGYFTLTLKAFSFPTSVSSKTLLRKIMRYGRNSTSQNEVILPVPFIAQLGKNFTNGYNKLIAGSELLELALNTVTEIQHQIGGRFVCLECEDKPKLVNFYSENGFVPLYNRLLDEDDRYGDADYLVQMIRYIK